MQKRTNHNIVWVHTNEWAEKKQQQHWCCSGWNDFKRNQMDIKNSIHEASGKRSTLIQWIFNEVRNNGFIFHSVVTLFVFLTLCIFFALNRTKTFFSFVVQCTIIKFATSCLCLVVFLLCVCVFFQTIPVFKH